MRYWLAISIAIAATYDTICLLLRKWDADTEQFCELPDGLIKWGTIRGYHGSRDRRYIVIRFPFISKWDMDFMRQRFCWHHPELFRCSGSWEVHWVAERKALDVFQ